MAAKTRIRKFGNLLSDSFLDYDTPKMVQIKSWKAGAVNRIVQLLIIFYAFGYVIIIEKGYQTTDKVLGSATSKLKGIASTNFTGDPNVEVNDIEPYNRVWDVTDYVIPAQVCTLPYGLQYIMNVKFVMISSYPVTSCYVL